ncbi:MAG: hypothetical protein RLZZ196_836 [Bacteroidota bacterium]|jgi:hypothetical protein
MSDFNDYASSLGIANLGGNFTDVIAFIFDSPREFNINANFDSIQTNKILEVKSFKLDLNQKSFNQSRYLGEGADPNTFSVGQISINGNLRTNLFQNDMGWVTPIFASIWHKTASSWWGTSTAAAGNLITSVVAGATSLETDNISDFSNLTTPFNLAIITDTETPENAVVTSVNKSTRTLTLQSALGNDHTAYENTLVCFQNNNSFKPETEPSFSLLSLREGLLAPCLINKINIEANSGQEVDVSIDFKALGIYRDRQIDLSNNKEQIISNFSSINDPERIINGTNVKLQIASANSGNFGLATALGDNLFSGFQGLDFTDFVVTGISLTIDNQLKEIYSNHSLKSNVQSRRRENVYPYALYSEGRTITGKIKYRSPIDFFSNLERLAGPSSINGGGLTIDYGNFKITMNELAWEPSSGESNLESLTREINFTMISETRNSMPPLEFSEQE